MGIKDLLKFMKPHVEPIHIKKYAGKRRAISINPSMAHHLIQILRSEEIEFAVAPYEADAQLAYLANLEPDKGGIDGVISEDNDLLAYGCPSIIFKMDQFGNGEEIVLSKVFESVDQVPSFRNLNMELFTGMCVLAGCDFLPSVPGIGIAKAYSLVSKYRNLDRALSMLKFEKRSVMPEDYTKSFGEALAVFQHALIYDAISKRLKHLKPLTEKFLQSLQGDHDFLGPDIPQATAIAITEGTLDPSTMQAFDHFPSLKSNLKSITTINQISNKLPIIDTTSGTKEVSCFSVITSHRTNNGRTARMSLTKQKPLKEECNFVKEVAALEKLMCPFITPPTNENKMCRDKIPLKMPENNPFKKRKVDKLQLEKDEIITEQVSVLTEIDTLDILSETPESQKSVNSKPINKTKKAKKEKSNNSNIDKKEDNKNSILNFFRRV